MVFCSFHRLSYASRVRALVSGSAWVRIWNRFRNIAIRIFHLVELSVIVERVVRSFDGRPFSGGVEFFDTEAAIRETELCRIPWLERLTGHVGVIGW